MPLFRTYAMKESLHPSNRLDPRNRRTAPWRQRRLKFSIAIFVAFILLQILFLGLMSYLYGSLWKSKSRYHSFRVLFLDFDQGVVGQATNLAYHLLKAPSFPSFISRNTTDYPSQEAALNAVRDGSFWAAVLVNPGSSDRLAAALRGGSAAQNYDPSAAVTYIWNEVRYPAFSGDAFVGSFSELATVVRSTYLKLNGVAALKTMNSTDGAAVRALFNPIELSAVNIMPTGQGVRLLFNTVSMVMPLLHQFFLLLIMNGISQKLQIYSKIPMHISGLVRIAISLVHDLVGSLCMTGYIWAFRESWSVNATQFVLTWMTLWLLFHIHFVVLDTMTAFVPLPGIPFFLLTWIILNLTSSLSPIEIAPAFYRWGYALPANEAYTILTDIWSSGGVPQLHRALPILFCWWIVGLCAAVYGHFHRCHEAWVQEKQSEDSSKTSLQPAQREGSFESGTSTSSGPAPSDRAATTLHSSPLAVHFARAAVDLSEQDFLKQQPQHQTHARLPQAMCLGEALEKDGEHGMETINGVPINQIPTAAEN